MSSITQPMRLTASAAPMLSFGMRSSFMSPVVATALTSEVASMRACEASAEISIPDAVIGVRVTLAVASPRSTLAA